MTTKFPDNSLSPDSKPWARTVERAVQDLERASDQTGSRQRNSASGMASTLSRLSEQVDTLSVLVAEQPILLDGAYISSASFGLTNTSMVTQASASLTVPPGAKFVLLLGDVSLNGGSSVTPTLTQVIHHQMVLSYSMAGGGTNELIINRFPSLIMPNSAGTPVSVDSGGPLSGVVGLDIVAPGADLTFNYQTQAYFSGYVGSGSVTANIYGLFFYRSLS